MDQLVEIGPPLRPQAMMVSSTGTVGFHTQASIERSASPDKGVESGPTYQSPKPSRVTAFTPSMVSTFGISNSASKSPDKEPSLIIFGSGPVSNFVISTSINAIPSSPLSGMDCVRNKKVSLLKIDFIIYIRL